MAKSTIISNSIHSKQIKKFVSYVCFFLKHWDPTYLCCNLGSSSLGCCLAVSWLPLLSLWKSVPWIASVLSNTFTDWFLFQHSNNSCFPIFCGIYLRVLICTLHFLCLFYKPLHFSLGSLLFMLEFFCKCLICLYALSLKEALKSWLECLGRFYSTNTCQRHYKPYCLFILLGQVSIIVLK